MKVIAMWVTFYVYLLLCIGAFGFVTARSLPEPDRILTLPEVVLFLILMIPVLVFGVYLADILWLLTWRRFFDQSRDLSGCRGRQTFQI